MIAVLAAIAASVAAGLLTERRAPTLARALTRRILDALLYLLLPFITFFVVARLRVDAGVGVGLLGAYAELALAALAAYLVGTRLLRASRPVVGTIMVGTLVANSGYLGIPLNAALLGRDAIAPAIAWDTVVGGPMFFGAAFAVGAAFGVDAGSGARERLRSFVLRNPPLIALIAALLVPDALAPDTLVTVAESLSFALLPLAFFVLGVTLAAEAEDGALAIPPPVTRPLVAIVGLRIVLAPLLFGAIGLLAGTFGARPPDAYFVQAAAPCGVNAILVAHAFGLDLKLAAGSILWSTALMVGVAVTAGLVLG